MEESTIDRLAWIKPKEVSSHSPDLSNLLRFELSNIREWKDFNKKFDKDSEDFDSESLEMLLSRDFSVGVTDQEFLSVDTAKFIDQRAGSPFCNNGKAISDFDKKIAMDNYRGFEIGTISTNSTLDYLKNPRRCMERIILGAISAIKKELGLNVANLYSLGDLEDDERVHIDIGDCISLWFEDAERYKVGYTFSTRVFIYAVKK